LARLEEALLTARRARKDAERAARIADERRVEAEARAGAAEARAGAAEARQAVSTAELRKHRSGWIPAFIPVARLQEVEPCRVCGAGVSDRHVFPYPSSHERFRALYVFGCASCGVSWVPSGSIDLDAYYASLYADENRGDRDAAPAEYFATLTSRPDYLERARRQVEHAQLLGRPIRRALDLGSGPGYLLHCLKESESGVDELFACEPDAASHKYLRYLGAEVLDWQELSTLRPLDVVVSSHSLEHFWLGEVLNVLRAVRAGLADDGLFVFEVPSADLLRTHWHYVHEPHTVFFSRDALDMLLEQAGFVSRRMIPLYAKEYPPRPDAVFQPKRYPELGDTGGILGVASLVEDDERVRRLVELAPS